MESDAENSLSAVSNEQVIGGGILVAGSLEEINQGGEACEGAVDRGPMDPPIPSPLPVG